MVQTGSQAFTKTPITVQSEHKQVPTRCYTTYGLTTHSSDYTTYGFYLGFGLLHTIASEIHIISKQGGSDHKVMVQSEHCFLSSEDYHMSCAIICSSDSLFCSSKASFHHYSEISFCGSAKGSHSCTQISPSKIRLGWLSPPLHRPLVLLPTPFLGLWGYIVGEDHLERGMATQPHPESIKPFGSHLVSPNPVLNLRQAEG